ncbi:hypothetical protein TNCV_1867551 [Trichonephila clavipes]|nr:hypothetical protein TNCV_1867551 [Trichonephila clavipes]
MSSNFLINGYVVVTNTTCLRMSDRDPRNSSQQSARCTPVLSVALSTIQVILRFRSVPPNFEGEHPRGSQGPLTSLSHPPTSREDLQLDSYLEYPMPQKHYTFTNIQAFSGIRTQDLRYSSQRC